jgi:hypothetical protein
MACTEQTEYTPTDEVSAGAQVYFPTTVVKNIYLSATSTSFEVEIMRVNTKGALTVGLTTTADASIFTIPSSVSFADGEDAATITINCNSSKLLPICEDIDITLADKNQVEYYKGIGPTYTFSTYLWTSLGEGSFDCSFFEETWPLEVQTINGTNMYRLVDCYGYTGYDINFTYDKETGKVEFKKQQTGYLHPTYGMVSIELASLTSYTVEDNEITFTFKYTIPDGRSFGEYDEILTLP